MIHHSSRLSIIIPVYNEATTIRKVLDKIDGVRLSGGVAKEILIINDGSTDDTEQVIHDYLAMNPALDLKYHRHNRNLGKGAAVQTGIMNAKGDYLIIQDADLEYDPDEYNMMLKPVLDGHADVVYGSRFTGGNARRMLFFWHSVGNGLLTFISNVFTDLNISDMETGFKLFRAEIIRQVKLKEQRFGFEPEITAKISRIKGVRIYEIGISYYGRGYQEGKKINWKDGFRAIYCILKYNIWSRN